MNEMQIQSRLDVGKLFLGNMKLLAESKFSQIIIVLKFIEKKDLALKNYINPDSTEFERGLCTNVFHRFNVLFF